MTTRTFLTPAALAAALWLGAGAARADLNVVATLPDLGAVAQAVGGEKITLAVLAKPTEDPHFVDARPSHVVKLNRADVLIEGGAELELGWLPPLLEGARNPKIAAGAPGRIVASDGIGLLDIPSSVDRSQGDMHSRGNPHFMLDPLNAKAVAAHVADAFCKLDAPTCPVYKANLAKFDASIDAKLGEWSAALKPFAGMPLVTYHTSWRYFAQRFGLKVDTFLEPKPGIPPSPPHLAEVIAKMNAEKIHTVLVEPYQERKVAEAVASRTGAKVADVAQFPGGLPGTDGDYVKTIDADVKAITAALGSQSGS